MAVEAREVRVCIDISPAVHGRAGMGRYAGELAAAMAALEPGPELSVFYNRARQATPAPPLDGLPRITTGLGDRPWRLRVLLAQLAGRPQDRLLPGVDVFHGTDHLLPRLAAARSVFTLHDLTFRLYPAEHTPLNRWFHRLMMPRFLRQASAVIAVSESTRRDALRLYGVDEARVSVIHEGVGAQFQPTGPEAALAVRRKYGLPERFILSVGTIEPRKNLSTLLDAYLALRLRGVTSGLVIAGRQGWRSRPFLQRLRTLDLQREVILPGHIAEADLPALYSAAALLAYPSLYEGFGLPVLEAMACSTPVVCSAASSLPEVAGDAALLVGPHDTSGWAEAMGRVLDDPALAASLSARGLARARRFTWTAAAQATMEVYSALGA